MPGTLAFDVFFRAAELDVHVAVNRHQSPGVFCLVPLEADDDFFVNETLQHRSRIEGDELQVDVRGWVSRLRDYSRWKSTYRHG